MLLRRITAHVKAQNWTAVAIDFAIVVVGVFIGIQVSNWNRVLSESVSAEEFEQRLKQDLVNQIREYDAAMSYFSAVRDSASRTLYQLEGGEIDGKTFLIDAYRATQYVDIIPVRATYDELKASGALRLINSGALRDAVSGVFETTELDEWGDRFKTSPYRLSFQRTIDPDLQRSIGLACGDSLERVVSNPGAYASIQAYPAIDYACDFAGEPQEIQKAV